VSERNLRFWLKWQEETGEERRGERQPEARERANRIIKSIPHHTAQGLTVRDLDRGVAKERRSRLRKNRCILTILTGKTFEI